MKRTLTTGALALAFLCVGMTVAVPAAHAGPIDRIQSVKMEKPAEGTPILLIQPEVSLSLLTAAGGQEPKEEWSRDARKHLASALTGLLTTRKYKVSTVDIQSYEDPEAVQLLKLNEAVSNSITYNITPGLIMPTKPTFDWTLGDGIKALMPADGTSPSYVMFVDAKGTYSSGGRAAMMVGMAALGVAMPMGGQVIQMTLVDMNTGKVVWYSNVAVPPGIDIREAAGAQVWMNELAKKMPL
ncbi:hypothetical protein [Asticcacaulis sp. 201]|uniref:hypothetical protein n=1 Tax=Asticcacaulis sp. 201 TaxID=3028787 RepID=UPI002916954A|nr:hypothetical protein [Asticcacaulis sp. 201]MDV6329841.1 hypothetical protein [Asticcacaulis sp. 201]